MAVPKVAHDVAVAGFPEAAIDAFGRLRTSDPTGLFDAQFQYDLQPLLWEAVTTTGGSVAHSATTSSATMETDGTSGASVTLQTRQYHRYQPGKSQLIAITYVMGAPTANVRRRVGYFADDNGVFLEQTSAGLFIVRRNNGTDTRVAQDDWNLMSLTGSPIHRLALDPTRAQILLIDLQWLGVGRVRVGFDIDGEALFVHEFRHANSVTSVYMTTANLPLRYSLESTAASAAATMSAICSTVISEGGFEAERGFGFTANNGGTGVAFTTRRALVSVRQKETFNTITNFSHLLLEGLDLAVTVAAGSGMALWELVYNPTYTTGGGALTWTQANGSSGAEYCVHGDANAGAFTDGIPVLSGYVVTSGNAQTKASVGREVAARYPVVWDYARTAFRAYALVVTQISGTLTGYGTLSWRELR